MSEFGFCQGCGQARVRRPGYVWNQGKSDQKELSASFRCPNEKTAPDGSKCKEKEWIKGTKPSELATQPASSAPQAAPQTRPAPAPTQGPSPDKEARYAALEAAKQRSISFQACAKAAAEAYSGQQWAAQDISDAVFTLAVRLYVHGVTPAARGTMGPTPVGHPNAPGNREPGEDEDLEFLR
jgi:hypothetical protein